MSDREFEAVFRGRARNMYHAFDQRDGAEIDALLNLIELDPFVDDVHTFKLLVPPLVLNAYDNGIWRIVYRIVAGAVEIFSVERNS